MAVSAVDMVSAEDAANSAREECKRALERVNENERRTAEIERQVDRTRVELTEVNKAIVELKAKIVESRRMFNYISDVQQKFRNACHLLGGFEGTVTVMEVQTRSFIFLKSVVECLDDIATKTSKISESDSCQRLLENEIKPLIAYLKGNLPRLKTIREKDVCDYY